MSNKISEVFEGFRARGGYKVLRLFLKDRFGITGRSYDELLKSAEDTLDGANLQEFYVEGEKILRFGTKHVMIITETEWESTTWSGKRAVNVKQELQRENYMGEEDIPSEAVLFAVSKQVISVYDSFRVSPNRDFSLLILDVLPQDVSSVWEVASERLQSLGIPDQSLHDLSHLPQLAYDHHGRHKVKRIKFLTPTGAVRTESIADQDIRLEDYHIGGKRNVKGALKVYVAELVFPGIISANDGQNAEIRLNGTLKAVRTNSLDLKYFQTLSWLTEEAIFEVATQLINDLQ